MINTISEITKKIHEFCDKSAIVNQYLEGDFSTFNSQDWHYPLIFVTPIKTRIKDGLVQFVCNIAFMNTIYEKNDLIKILSDLNILITELYIYLSDDSQHDMYFIILLTSLSSKSPQPIFSPLLLYQPALCPNHP